MKAQITFVTLEDTPEILRVEIEKHLRLRYGNRLLGIEKYASEDYLGFVAYVLEIGTICITLKYDPNKDEEVFKNIFTPLEMKFFMKQSPEVRQIVESFLP